MTLDNLVLIVFMLILIEYILRLRKEIVRLKNELKIRDEKLLKETKQNTFEEHKKEGPIEE